MKFVGPVIIGLVIALLQANTGTYAQCNDGDIRYHPVNVSVIQVCLDDEWTYVCGQESAFSDMDVAVACNQLGNKSDENSDASVPVAKAPQDSPVGLRSFYCTGLESRLVDCPIHNTYNTNILSSCKKSGNFYYAAVDCSYDEIDCINGEIQEGDKGVIEICANGEFRPICGDPDGWNDKDAETACRELGHNPDGAKSIFRGSNDSNPPYPVRFHCTGNEETLTDCPKQLLMNDNCGTDAVAFLSCGDELEGPVITDIVPSSDRSQLTIIWATSGDLSNSYEYQLTCTSATLSQTIIFQARTTSGSTSFTGMPSNRNYNCCVAIVDESIISEPRCEDYFFEGAEDGTRESSSPSCLIAVTSSTSMVPRTTDTGRTTAQQVIEDYGPWGYGFIIGLVVGVIVMMAICGCCLAVCLRKEKKKSKMQYDVAGAGFVSVNASANPHSNNPLYNMTSDNSITASSYAAGNSVKYGPEEKKLASNEYDYSCISERPLPSVPQSEQISPYLTTTSSTVNKNNYQ